MIRKAASVSIILLKLPSFRGSSGKASVQGTFHEQLDFLLYWLNQLMILEFEEGKKRMQKSLKKELFSASYASGVILRKQARKLRRMRMNAQLVGFLKSGNQSL